MSENIETNSPASTAASQAHTAQNLVTGRWTRSSHGMIAGVCKGLAERMQIEPWLMRLIWIVAVCVGGVGLLAYLVFAICLPRDDRWQAAQEKMILGVCSRIAKKGEIEIGIARIIAVSLLFLSFGSAIVGYVVLYFVIPEGAGKEPNPNSPPTSLF